MSNEARPLHYKVIKHLLEQIDRAEFAKKMIQQANQALKNKDDDALIKLGFSAEQITELTIQQAGGEANSHFVNTPAIDNVISRLRNELAELVRKSIHSKGVANSEVDLIQPSELIETTQQIDYFTDSFYEDESKRTTYKLPGKYGVSFLISPLVDSV
jgi:hypothetical protein